MSLSHLTKIVALALTLTVVAACTDNVKDQPALAVGAGSETGKALLKHSWCTETKNSPDGSQIYIDEYVFEANGEVNVTAKDLQTDGTLKPRLEDKGTWALMGDQLFVMNRGRSVPFKIQLTHRSTDQAECLDLGDGQQLCTCAL